MKFQVTIEALKRAIVEVEASDEDDAKAKVQQKLRDGADFIECGIQLKSLMPSNNKMNNCQCECHSHQAAKMSMVDKELIFDKVETEKYYCTGCEENHMPA